VAAALIAGGLALTPRRRRKARWGERLDLGRLAQSR